MQTVWRSCHQQTLGFVAIFSLLFSSMTLGQNAYTYRAFLDTDVNTVTGCEFDMGTSSAPNQQTGFEYYLELAMVAPGEINQYAVSGAMIACDNGVWDTSNPTPITSGSWDATLSETPGSPDSIEGFIPRSALGYSTIARVVVNAKDETVDAADSLGDSVSSPVFIEIFGENIPVLSNVAFALLLIILAIIAFRSKRARLPVSGVVLLLSFGSGFHIVSVDGQAQDHCAIWGWCVDWSGISPTVDSDATAAYPHIDLTAVSMTEADNGDIALRIDVADVNNACTSLSPCDANASCSNEPSGYSCTCNENFFGDGFTCTEAGSALTIPMQHSVYGTLIPVTCVDGDCSCPVGFSGPGVIIVYSYAYSGVCTEVQQPDNSNCSNGTCTCDSGYASDSIFGDPVWNPTTQTYDGNCVAQINALYDQAFFDVPAYQFSPELSSGEFGVTTWQ